MKKKLVTALVLLCAVACIVGCGTKGEQNQVTPTVFAGWPFDTKEAKRRQKQTAKELDVPVEITNSIGMKLVLIPAGEFMMGSKLSPAETEQRYGSIAGLCEREHPRHRVEITRPFYIGAYEVTQAQHEAIMGENPSRFKGAENPVEVVSWNRAVEFCRRLSRKDGQPYWLPTEAEWEYACRAGTDTAFYCGDSLSSEQANLFGLDPYGSGSIYRRRTTAVGTFPPNAWGLYDMHGNVSEWCSDWYAEDYYRSSPIKDPQGPRFGDGRIRRGGYWYNSPKGCRSARRAASNPRAGWFYNGFRVVLPATAPGRKTSEGGAKLAPAAEDREEARQPGMTTVFKGWPFDTKEAKADREGA